MSSNDLSTTARRSAGRRARAAFVAVMLVALGAQTVWSAIANSTTWDESSLLTTGLAALRTGDFRMSKGAPPLMDMLSALAAMAGGAPPLPLDSAEWRAGQDDMFALRYFWRGAAAPHAPRLIFLARLPIIAVSMGLAVLVFIWARQLYGWPAAALALGLYVFEPNLLAHSSLATSDLGTAAFSLLCVYAYWRYARSPSRWALALAGVALGAAALAKFSGLLLLVVLAPLAVVADEMNRRSDARRRSPWRLLGGLAAIVAIAAVTIWAGYGFTVEPVSGAPFAVRLPAGRFLSGVLTQGEHQKWGHLAYLMGWASTRGWWYYYPVAFAVKTSLPFICLLGIAIGLRRFRADEAFLVIPVAAFFAAAMVQGLDLGLRYILPIYPFLVIFAARTAARAWPAARPRWGRAAVGVLALWVMIEALLYAPQYIPYFNELAGGPVGGSRYLVDSNLDWGQDLKRLASWQRRHPEVPTIHLAYFGFADPTRYGVRAHPLPVGRPDWAPSPAWPLQRMPESWYRTAGRPRAGWIAVSATVLALDPRYEWLEPYRPVARAGYSIWIYHIRRKPAGDTEG